MTTGRINQVTIVRARLRHIPPLSLLLSLTASSKTKQKTNSSKACFIVSVRRFTEVSVYFQYKVLRPLCQCLRTNSATGDRNELLKKEAG
jgi:hypothetical protein